MNGHRKSDRPIVPEKHLNNGSLNGQPAEGVEERGLTKKNPMTPHMYRTQGRERMQMGCDRVRKAAQRDKRLRFTSVFHHIANKDTLREGYYRLNRQAAPGVDKETWKSYGRELESNLEGLCGRLRRGAYRAKPVQRAYIPKMDGRLRPLGLTVLEDKIVQQATVTVLNAIYETDFLGFSYGFRPGRNPHQALDALAIGLERKRVRWVLDADIRGFFDAISHEWMIKFIEHRIGDQRVVRLIRKWLNAGVLEDGKLMHPDGGTPQGGVISPLLANIYLHYVLDLWTHHWRRHDARGEVIIVRYADDFVVGFQRKEEAERFLSELRSRFAKYGLELHPGKTRLVEFGRWACINRAKRGEGKPETISFLGFTHICGKTKKGWFQVRRITERKRMIAKLKEVKAELAHRWHDPIPEVGRWLGSVVRGHCQYYGVPLNYQAIDHFRRSIRWLWRRALERRSQRAKVKNERMKRIAERWLPTAHICHPYPNQRLCVNIQGRSPVR